MFDGGKDRCDGCGKIAGDRRVTHRLTKSQTITYCPNCEAVRKLHNILVGDHEQYQLQELKNGEPNPEVSP